jgi:signal transduction histidine kinase/CheY-like chemotaxis protein
MIAAAIQVYSVGGETKKVYLGASAALELVGNLKESVLQQNISTIQLALLVNGASDDDSRYTIQSANVNEAPFMISHFHLMRQISDVESFFRTKQAEGGFDLIYDEEIILSVFSELYKLRKMAVMYGELVEKDVFIQNIMHIADIDLGVLEEVMRRGGELSSQTNIIKVKVQELSELLVRRLPYYKRIAVGYIVLVSIFSILLATTIVLLIFRNNISIPLRQLTDSINRYSPLHKVLLLEEDKHILNRQDELGRMGRSFLRLKKDLWEQGKGLKLAIKGAEEANKAKSVFLASASHDIRQPLNAMQMYIAVLKARVKDEEALQIVNNIDSVSLSTARLLNALLDVSELEAGLIIPRVIDFSVNDIFSSIFDSFQPVAEEKKLKLRIVPTKLWVKTDPALLERIVGNFVSNSIRYTEVGSVLIGCRRRGDKVLIEVLDTGVGIHENQISSIFKDFYQIQNKERDRSKGLGLGLALARRLAATLGHEITTKSNLGLGSCFSVLVSVGNENNIQGKVSIPGPLQDLDGTKVLLIEDDDDVLKATTQLLESWGCCVWSGSGKDEVFRLLDEASLIPQIIVADNRLPGEFSGVDIVSMLRVKLDSDIPSIIVTGDVERAHVESIRSQGFPVLLKPIRPAKFRAIIRRLLNA